MRSRTFRDKEARELEKQGFSFQGAESNGLRFEKLKGGQVHGALLQQSGRVRRIKPYTPTAPREKQRWGIRG